MQQQASSHPVSVAADAATPAKHPYFTKLDASGNALPDDATSWFAVRVLDGSIRFDMLAANVGSQRVGATDAEQAVAALGAGGFTDWRLPTLRELERIVDRTRYSPSVDPQFFPDIRPNYYWSSSPVASGPDYAWFVYFNDGYVALCHRGSRAFVRAVRSVPASQ